MAPANRLVSGRKCLIRNCFQAADHFIVELRSGPIWKHNRTIPRAALVGGMLGE
jgi:hypothetical protein